MLLVSIKEIIHLKGSSQGSYKAINLSNYQTIQSSVVKPKLHINSGENSAQSTNKKISIKQISSKRNSTAAIQDPNMGKLN